MKTMTRALCLVLTAALAAAEPARAAALLGEGAIAPIASAPVAVPSPAPTLIAPALSAAAALPAAELSVPLPLAAPALAAAAAAPVAAPTAAAALTAAAVDVPAFSAPGASAGAARSGAARAFDAAAAAAAPDAALVIPGFSAARKFLPSGAGLAPKNSSRRTAKRLALAAFAAGTAIVLHHFGLHPAAALAPFAFLAGTLGSGAPQFSKVQLDAALNVISRDSPAGTPLAAGAQRAIELELGLDAPTAVAAINALVRRGDIGVRGADAALRFSFGARVRAGLAAGPEAEADAAAARAVNALNAPAPLDHARGLVDAARALELYDRSERETSRRVEQRAEAKVLRDNLAVEHIGDLLSIRRAQLERQPAGAPQRAQTLSDIDAALAWVNAATFTRGFTPALPRATRDLLLKLLERMNPVDEQGAGLVDAYVEAFDLIETYDPSRLDAPPSKTAPPSAVGDSAAARRFGEHILETVRPGGAVTPERRVELARELGLDAAAADDAVRRMALDGWLAVRDNGVLIRLSFPGRLEESSSNANALRPSLETALAGARLLNSPNALDHLRAVARLEKAKEELMVARRAGADEGRLHEEFGVLYANSVLEVAGDALRALERSLDERLSGKRAPAPSADERPDFRRRRDDARESLRAIADAYYSSDRLFRLPPKRAEKLVELLDLRAFREVISGGAIDESHEVVRGVRLARAFLQANASPDRAIAGGVADPDENVAPTPGGFRPLPRSLFPTLLKYGTDITRKAVEGQPRPLIGRKAEMRQIVKTLLRVEKNNPLVIGEKGVGKTALVNGLARMIAQGEIPELRGRNVVKLDLTKLVAGASGRGVFEKRLKDIVEEAAASQGRVILFIDELHTLIGAGDAEGAVDAASILKESLADGSIALIGATTYDEFRKIEKDGALMRRFNPVKLAAPTKAEAEEILEGVKSIYEAKHAVHIPPETVKAAVSLASRYVSDRALPDSALDLLDDASAEVELKARENPPAPAAPGELSVDAGARIVRPQDVAAEITLRTGAPAGELNADKKAELKRLPARLKSEVIGQDHAVEAVARAVQRGELGYRDPKQPIGAFVFLGPTGVGKTELARALARVKFGSEKNMLRLDMSEYQEKHSVSRLISAPPGYVGHDEGGQLTEPIRRNPYQVILLDEIEKAHPDVFDVLLQVLEDGRLTDSSGRVVDFSNTIIVMTSNLGAGEENDARNKIVHFPDGDYRLDGMGFNARWVKVGAGEGRRDHYLKEFKAKYRPEFVNRVGEDGVIVFNDLSDKAKLEQILDLRLAALNRDLSEKKLRVALTPAAREAALAKALANTRYGARPLKQLVDRELNQALTDAESDGRIADGDRVLVDWDAAAGRYRADKAPDSLR